MLPQAPVIFSSDTKSSLGPKSLNFILSLGPLCTNSRCTSNVTEHRLKRFFAEKYILIWVQETVHIRTALSLALRNLNLSRYEPLYSPGCGPNDQGLDSRARQKSFLCSRTSISTLFNEEELLFVEGADKSLAQTTSQCVLFDGQNISFDASLVLYIYINSTNIPPIMIINRIYETQNLLSL